MKTLAKLMRFGRVRETLCAVVREADPAARHQHPVADVGRSQARHKGAERQAKFVIVVSALRPR
jgi:hypothetical protein